MPQFCSVIRPFEEACADDLVHLHLRSIAPGIVHTELRQSNSTYRKPLLSRAHRRECAPFDARQSASARSGRRNDNIGGTPPCLPRVLRSSYAWQKAPITHYFATRRLTART